MDIDIEQLRTLMQTIEEFGINELELRNGEERIRLNRGAPVAVAQALAAPAAAASHHVATGGAAGESASAPQEVEEGIAYITSPFVGTFYRAPSPDSDPFINEGDSVTVGQAICIVEAMKMMNEIEAEISGTIVAVLAENGKPVEYGDQLFKVKSS